MKTNRKFLSQLTCINDMYKFEKRKKELTKKRRFTKNTGYDWFDRLNN